MPLPRTIRCLTSATETRHSVQVTDDSLDQVKTMVEDFIAENDASLQVTRSTLGSPGWEVIELEPTSAEAARVSLILATDEVIATVGRQGRYEMGTARECLDGLGQLLAAVRDGRVQETIKLGASKTRVQLAGGRSLSTTNLDGPVPWTFRGRARIIHYGPYTRA